MRKRKPEIARDQMSTIAPSQRAPGSKGVPRRKVAGVHAAGAFTCDSWKSAGEPFECPNGHQELHRQHSLSGVRKPVMQRIVCGNDCCGFRSDRWALTEKVAIANWNKAVVAKRCSDCEEAGRCPNEIPWRAWRNGMQNR
jgi:hypothetical protein